MPSSCSYPDLGACGPHAGKDLYLLHQHARFRVRDEADGDGVHVDIMSEVGDGHLARGMGRWFLHPRAGPRLCARGDDFPT